MFGRGHHIGLFRDEKDHEHQGLKEAHMSLPVVLTILASLSTMASVGCLVAYLVQPKDSDLVKSRMQAYAPKARNLTEIELQAPFSERVVKPLAAALSSMVRSRTPEATIAKMQQKLVVAGKAGEMQVSDLLGMKGLFAILFVMIAFAMTFLLHTNLLKGAGAIGFALVLGYFGPDIWLGQEAGKRRKSLQDSLPDALDLLTIMVEAGLGFDGALQKLVEKYNNPLTIEFNSMLSEMRLGKTQREALKALSDRCDVDDITTFCTSLVQALQLGVTTARVLRIQSYQMRLKRRQRAEEKAHQAPIKMLFPMIFLTFPAMFIMILGPAVVGYVSKGGVGAGL